MKGLWNLLSSFIIIALLIWFVRWYVKGNFGKYAIFFWAYSIFTIILYLNRPDHNPNWPQHDSTPGYVYWERNIK